MVLLDVGLLAFLSLLSLVKDQLTKAPIIVLLLKFGDAVLSHLGLDVFTFLFTGQTVIFEYGTNLSDRIYLHELLDVLFIRLLV